MSDPRTIPTRPQVKAEETWDLTDLFADFVAWDKAFALVPKEAEIKAQVAGRFHGKLAESPCLLHEALKFREELGRTLEKLAMYAHLRQDEDLGNTTAVERSGRIDALVSNFNAAFSFLEPEILRIPGIEKWLSEEPLATYAFPLQEILRNKEHILGESEEQILTKLQLPLSRFGDVYKKWKNVDLRFPPAVDSSGEEHLVSNARYTQLVQSRDRSLRRSAFYSFFEEHRRWRSTIAAAYFGCLQAGSIEAQLRRFASFREEELFQDDVPVSVYDELISTVRGHLPIFHKSIALRKKVLGLDQIEHWDRVVSISDTQEFQFSWDEAVNLILESLAPMGVDYVNIARRGLREERWVDFAENQGKRSGAYSWGCYDSRPYILMSWTSSVRDVFTLAHELGHSMHTHITNESQPYHLSHYKIFVAEVASTFHEILLANHILKCMPTSDLARRVVTERIQGFEGNTLRQTLFATFERDAAKLVDDEEALTPDLLDEIYFNLCREWHGPDYHADDLVAHEWLLVPHFYTPFYVYKYATSQCASEALAEYMLTDPKEGRERFLRFVRCGGSKAPLQILLDADVDLCTSEPINNAFASYRRNLATAERLFAPS